MVIVFVHSNRVEDRASVQVRCLTLAQAINRTQDRSAFLLDIYEFIHNTPQAQQICQAADIIIIQEYLFGAVLKRIQYWKARDKRVVADLNIPVQFLRPNHLGFSFWHGGHAVEDFSFEAAPVPGDTLPIEQLSWGVSMVDGVITSSEALAADWRHLTKVEILQDYLNTDQYPGLSVSNQTSVCLGVVATSVYEMEHSGLDEALHRVLNKIPDLKISYYFRSQQVEAKKQNHFFSSARHEAWVSNLPNLSLGLLPLFGEFDLRLGRFSFLEFMISKVPWVSSQGSFNYSVLDHGHCIKNTPDAWENAICVALDHLEEQKARAENEAFLFALRQDAHSNINKILSLFANFL